MQQKTENSTFLEVPRRCVLAALVTPRCDEPNDGSFLESSSIFFVCGTIHWRLKNL